jgi:hypothetical protein
MGTNIIEILISVLAGVSLAISVTALRTFYKNLVASPRASSLTGEWTGKILNEDGVEQGVMIRFNVKGNDIRGKAVIMNEKEHRLNLLGEYSSPFIILRYDFEDPAILNIGQIMLKLSNTGNVIKGKYISSSLTSESLIVGSMELKRA